MSKGTPPLPTLPRRYRLWPSAERALLGTGGASTVWRVQDEALGVLVALKVLKNNSPGFLASLEREAVLASRVVHPNVIALHDMGRAPDGSGYLAFALASDGSLLDLAGGPVAWPELLLFTTQMLEALAALHSRGILHLDIKLGNLLLHRTGSRGARELWLADLGVARALHGEDDADKSVIGTVSYMAPERLTGQHNLWCPASDLFSVGAVLYRLLSGELPYPARDPVSALDERDHPPKTVPLRPGMVVPPGLDEVLLPMLEPDFRARYDYAADVIRALKQLPGLPEPDDQEGRTTVFGSPAAPRRAVRPVPNPAGRPEQPPPAGVKPYHRPPAWTEPPLGAVAPPNRRVPQAPALMLHREIQLVGRDTELDMLWRAARTVIRGRRPLLIELCGPEGCGRTRLVSEFVRAMEERGVGEGVRLEYAVRNSPDAGLRGAWRRVLRPGEHRDLYVEDLAGLLARDRGCPLPLAEADAQRVAEWLLPLPGGPPPRRSAVQEMMIEHLVRRSWRGLSTLWLEDADLADENDDCWDIVEQLMGRSAPVLVLVTTRADRPCASLTELRARHHKVARRVHIDPLGPADSESLVQAHLPLEPALAASLARHTAGNPRLVHEVLRHWLRAGMLEEITRPGQPGRSWRLVGGELHIPADAPTLARERLAVVGPELASCTALCALALSEPGCRDDVIRRIDKSGLDRLVVEGLVELQQGVCALQPPALAAVVRESIPPSEQVRLHLALAESWAMDGGEAALLARVGRHLLAAQRPDRAWPLLGQALRALHRSLPVPALLSLASDAARAARAVGAEAAELAVLAAQIRVEATWRAGLSAPEAAAELAALTPELALALDARLHPRPDLLPALGEALRRAGPRGADRAELLLGAALCRAIGLDLDGAVADLLAVLALRPAPEIEAQARLLRARLLAVADPMVAWNESLRVVELSRDHGLLRFEALAWGLAAEPMVFLLRGEEAHQRLRAAVDRLVAHGDRRAAGEVQLHLARSLRAAGRTEPARAALHAAMELREEGEAGYATVALNARPQLAVLQLLEGRGAAPLPLRDPLPAEQLLGRVLHQLVELPGGTHVVRFGEEQTTAHTGDATPIEPSAMGELLALGVDGLFLARCLLERLDAADRRAEALPLVGGLREACRAAGVELAEADALLERMRRATA
ncbi:MAG: hypothetical protein RL071_276 [Pseudomonadota bacterium]|jgi:hypothetical protein